MPRSKLQLNERDILYLYNSNVPLDQAAKSLGVSRSTLKSRCRELGISTWPFVRADSPSLHAQSFPVDPVERRALSVPRDGFFSSLYLHPGPLDLHSASRLPPTDVPLSPPSSPKVARTLFEHRQSVLPVPQPVALRPATNWNKPTFFGKISHPDLPPCFPAQEGISASDIYNQESRTEISSSSENLLATISMNRHLRRYHESISEQRLKMLLLKHGGNLP
ncbi:hypothetical protein RCL1_006523 [Eukaryota sp. TZLM3-RCL]